ncbi:hypothetical protein ACJX0J_037834, partial [Zea mays]
MGEGGDSWDLGISFSKYHYHFHSWHGVIFKETKVCAVDEIYYFLVLVYDKYMRNFILHRNCAAILFLLFHGYSLNYLDNELGLSIDEIREFLIVGYYLSPPFFAGHITRNLVEPIKVTEKIYGIALAIFISSCLIIALYAQMHENSGMIISDASSKSTIYRYGWLLSKMFSFIACETFTCEIDIIMRTLVGDHISLEHFTSQHIYLEHFTSQVYELHFVWLYVLLDLLMIDCLPILGTSIMLILTFVVEPAYLFVISCDDIIFLLQEDISFYVSYVKIKLPFLFFVVLMVMFTVLTLCGLDLFNYTSDVWSHGTLDSFYELFLLSAIRNLLIHYTPTLFCVYTVFLFIDLHMANELSSDEFERLMSHDYRWMVTDVLRGNTVGDKTNL